jgi:putative endonuclease
MYCTYVLKSSSSGILYKGHTSDLKKRVKSHNTPGSRFTSKDGPWTLMYFEEFETRAEAMKREKFFKSGKGRSFLQNILTLR